MGDVAAPRARNEELEPWPRLLLEKGYAKSAGLRPPLLEEGGQAGRGEEPRGASADDEEGGGRRGETQLKMTVPPTVMELITVSMPDLVSTKLMFLLPKVVDTTVPLA